MSPPSPIRAAILTVSDRGSRGQTVDLSGPALEALVQQRLAGVIVARACVPDEPEPIRAAVQAWAQPDACIDLVLTTGGTGLSPRDRTPEAVLGVLDRQAPGLMELARARCLPITPRAFLSRGVAGTLGRTLVITLPGSPRGATEQLTALLDILPHAIETTRGDVQDDGRPGAIPTTGKVVTHTD